MIPEDDFVMISALQHYCFCPRQCALIHVEGLWRNNALTVAGSQLHDRVDQQRQESRPGIKHLTALRLISRRLGVFGVADMVELHKTPSGWQAYPVEYKHGKPKEHRADEVQLCAQAIALEEMRHETIPEGALFYGATRRRLTVHFDETLRTLTEHTARAVRALIDAGITPPPTYTPACEACSLYPLCRPKEVTSAHSAKLWIQCQLGEAGL